MDLTVTDRYSGDNYEVAVDCHAGPDPTNHKTGNLVAWKRMYLERDNMLTLGATLTAAFASDGDANPDTLTVDATGDFNIGDNITVFSPTVSVDTTVSGKAANTLTIPDLNTNFGQYSGVKPRGHTTTFTCNIGLFTAAYGNNAEGTDGGTFVEYMDAPTGSGSIPRYGTFPNDGDIVSFAFCTFWFANSAAASDLFQYVAADRHADGSFGTTRPAANISFVTTGNFAAGATKQDAVDESGVHEVGHQFDVANGHVDQNVNARDDSDTDECVMSYNRARNNRIVEFDTDCLYDVRDASAPR